MKIKDLKEMLNKTPDHYLDQEVQVVLSIPSIGPTATSEVENASLGFDWDKGLLLKTKEKLVEKSEQQEVFEKGYSLLMYLATQSFVSKKESYAQTEAKRILISLGVSEDQIKKYVHLYHK